MRRKPARPNDGTILKTFGELSNQQLETALANTASCFEIWRHTSSAEKEAAVSKVAAIMRLRINEFARLATL
jgi:succinate-semialdehyde dehydrogenase/glutarate-semialdehyde dehydrogenase